MTLRVAITRAEPEASATAQRIAAMGAEPVLAPLLFIEPAPFDTNLGGVQALLFTSANGVRAFAAQSTERSPRVLAVGDATAAAAQSAGFSNIDSANGDAAALAALAQDRLKPGDGRVLHISGAHVAGDLAGALAAAGFDVERRIAYEARATSVLPDALKGRVDILLFHSARAAEAYLALGAPASAQRIAACISPAVAEIAGRARWARLVVAPRPRENDLLRAALTE